MNRVLQVLAALMLILGLVACGAGSNAGPVSVSDFVVDGQTFAEIVNTDGEVIEVVEVVDGRGNENSTNTGFGVATLNWTPPLLNTDNTSLTDLAGYNIYYGTDVNDMTTVIKLENPGLTSYVIENLAVGNRYYFAMTAYNGSNIESQLSVVVSKQF